MAMTKSHRRRITTIVRYVVLSALGGDRVLPDLLDHFHVVQANDSGLPGRPIIFRSPPTLANYMNVWFGAEQYATTQYAISSQTPLISMLNSTVIATTSTFPSVLFGSMIAYGVSRYRILSEVRMFQLLMLRMIPPIVVVAPLSLYYTAIGLIDTRIGLILVYFLTTLPYAVWMTKSFIDEVPIEVEQAAEILGPRAGARCSRSCCR